MDEKKRGSTASSGSKVSKAAFSCVMPNDDKSDEESAAVAGASAVVPNMKSKKSKTKKSKERIEISSPTNFRHLQHLGPPSSTYNNRNSENEDDLFQDAEVNEEIKKVLEELKLPMNKRVKKFVLQFINERGGIEEFKKEIQKTSPKQPQYPPKSLREDEKTKSYLPYPSQTAPEVKNLPYPQSPSHPQPSLVLNPTPTPTAIQTPLPASSSSTLLDEARVPTPPIRKKSMKPIQPTPRYENRLQPTAPPETPDDIFETHILDKKSGKENENQATNIINTNRDGGKKTSSEIYPFPATIQMPSPMPSIPVSTNYLSLNQLQVKLNENIKEDLPLGKYLSQLSPLDYNHEKDWFDDLSVSAIKDIVNLNEKELSNVPFCQLKKYIEDPMSIPSQKDGPKEEIQKNIDEITEVKSELISTDYLNLNELEELLEGKIDSDSFRLIRFGELFAQLPSSEYLHQSDWLDEFSINELTTLFSFCNLDPYEIPFSDLKVLIENPSFVKKYSGESSSSSSSSSSRSESPIPITISTESLNLHKLKELVEDKINKTDFEDLKLGLLFTRLDNKIYTRNKDWLEELTVSQIRSKCTLSNEQIYEMNFKDLKQHLRNQI